MRTTLASGPISVSSIEDAHLKHKLVHGTKLVTKKLLQKRFIQFRIFSVSRNYDH